MPSVRVRFITTRSFISAAIRHATGSLFSHVEFGTPEGTWIGAHAGDGIRERSAGYCQPSREYVYEIPCAGLAANQLLIWARSKVGTEYNYADILGLLVASRRLTSPSRMICSQFCTEGLLQAFGSAAVLNVRPEWAYRITPEMLHLSPIFVGRLVKKVR